jgi:hypothetical protein
VQVHRVHLAAGVADVHPHDVAGHDGEHRQVGEHVAVDRPPQPGRPCTNPGRRPMAYWKVRVAAAGSNPSGAGVP